MTDVLNKIARDCGGRLESWMTYPPRAAEWHFTPENLMTFASILVAGGPIISPLTQDQIDAMILKISEKEWDAFGPSEAYERAIRDYEQRTKI